MSNNVTTNQREQFWDIVKGVAIILMLLGHSIQCGQGVDYYRSGACLDNSIFKLIYGFHMPLFIFVSGYFFYKSIERRSLSGLCKKIFFQLIVPMVVFSTLLFFIKDHKEIVSMGLGYTVKGITYSFLRSLWFLWAVLYSSLLLGVSNKLKIDSLWIQILIIIAILYPRFS